jgi:hypothetical protein
LTGTKEYAFQYYVGTAAEGATRLADAYSRKILDPDNDSYISSTTYDEDKTYPQGAEGIVSVFKTEPDTYTWKNTAFKMKDKDDLVIYEMLLRDFTTSGDLNGAKAKLSYLKSLGVNAIELMPVQEFDGNDSWGYNPCSSLRSIKRMEQTRCIRSSLMHVMEKALLLFLMWFIIMPPALIRLLNFIGTAQRQKRLLKIHGLMWMRLILTVCFMTLIMNLLWFVLL